MYLFPKKSVPQAKFCWLGNLEKLVCPWKESVSGKYTIQGVRGDLVYTIACIFYLFISPSLIEGVNVSHRPLPIAYGRQVAGFRCTLLAGNSSISLTGSEEQINFSKQSPKMLKMASESFIYALLLFLSLFLKFSVGCLCQISSKTSFPKFELLKPLSNYHSFCPYENYSK